ncbi:MAG: diaminopimelate decarboxylase [Chlorobi bacterium]|nr:diaminopimelate decarboxylase [Chlorobiota bacterium]
MDRRLLIDIARIYGTPVYVYDLEDIRKRMAALREAFPSGTDIHYAVKANANPAVIRTVAEAGGKFDTVSPQEVAHLLELGVPPEDILFTPSCPSESEVEAALDRGVAVHLGEPHLVDHLIWTRPGAEVGLRINPDIRAGGHAKISVGHGASKFGIPLSELERIQEAARRGALRVKGLHVHLGSDMEGEDALYRALDLLFDLAEEFPDAEYIDAGGGFKVAYTPGGSEAPIEEIGKYVQEKLSSASRPLRFKIEPGKFLVSRAGNLVVEATGIKRVPGKNFLCVNSGFNHFLRPMYYGAYHRIDNLTSPEGPDEIYDVVGYLCEEDTFARARPIPRVTKGDLLAVRNAGAYGMVMASRYNLRPLPKEVAVDGDRIFEV